MTDLANYSVKILDKDFVGDVSKEVYLEACKWLAKNVYSSPSYSDNISVQIKKSEKEIEKKVREKKTGRILTKKQTRTVFTVSLYCVRDLNVAIKEHCDNCRHLHNLFFQMNDMHCEECKVTALQKKLEHEVVNLAESLRKSFEEGEQDD